VSGISAELVEVARPQADCVKKRRVPSANIMTSKDQIGKCKSRQSCRTPSRTVTWCDTHRRVTANPQLLDEGRIKIANTSSSNSPVR